MPNAPFLLTVAVEVDRLAVGREGRPAAVLDAQLPLTAVGLHDIEIGPAIDAAPGGACDPVALGGPCRRVVAGVSRRDTPHVGAVGVHDVDRVPGRSGNRGRLPRAAK